MRTARSPLLVVFVTVFIDLLGFGIIIPLLPFYAESFGASALTVGLLSASYSFMQFIFAPIWGRLSDRVGRRPIILLGLLGSAVSYLVFGLAESLTVLFVSRMCAGIAGANIPTAQAFIADTTTPDNRAKGMGLIGAAFGLGFIFGPAIGGFASQWGYAMPAFFAAALSFTNWLGALVFLPESRPAAVRVEFAKRGGRVPGRLEAFRAAVGRRHLPALLVVYFIVIMAFSAFEATFALFAERRFAFTSTTIGYLFAFVGIVLAIVQGGLVGRASALVGERRLVPAGIATLALGLLLTAWSEHVVLLTTAAGVLAVGMGFNSPSLMSLISRLSARDDQGGILGVSQSLASLARVAGPAAGGLVFDQLGITVPFLLAASLMGVALVVSLLALRQVDLDREVPVPGAATGG